MTKAAKTYDIKMTIGGTEYGFMLVQQKGKRFWEVYDSPTVSPQFTSGEPGYANYPPEREIVTFQHDWRGGIGHNFYDGKPVFGVSGCDTRWKDKVITRPLQNQTTLAAGATLAGSGIGFVEFGDNLYLATTNILYKWDNTNSLWVVAKDFGASVITDVISYNCFLWVALGSSTNYQISADGSTFYAAKVASSKAKYFTVLGYSLFKGITPNEVRIGSNPERDLTISACTAGSPTTGGSVDDGTHSYKIGFFFITPAVINGSTGTGTASNTITCGGGSNTVPLTGIPLSPITDSYRVIYRTKAGGTTYYFLCYITNNTDTTYTDTTADASLTSEDAPATPWGLAIYVGDTETDIVKLINYRTKVYVGKEEGLYSITSGGTVAPELTEFRANRDTRNFTKMIVWQDKLFFNIGKGGIYCWDGSTLDYLGWDLLAPYTGIYSEIGGFAPGYDFLYVIVKALVSGALGSIFTLREENIDGTTDWRWHALGFLTDMDTPGCAYISPLQAANPRLWIAGYDAHGSLNKPEYVILPRIGSTPDSDSNYKFTTVSAFYTSNYDMGFRADRKLFTSIDIISSHPTTAQYISVGYAIDGASSYTAISGNITSGPVTRKYINQIGRYISIGITMVSDDTTKTPVLYGIALRAVLRAQRRKVYEYAIRVADNIIQSSGIMEKNLASLVATKLRNADDPTVQESVVTLKDLDSSSHNVVFESMREVEAIDEVSKKRERHFYIRALEVNVA